MGKDLFEEKSGKQGMGLALITILRINYCMPTTISFLLLEHRILPLLMGYVKTTIVFIITKLLLLSFSFGSKEKKKGGASLFFIMTCHCLRILKRKIRFCFCYWSHSERILPGSTDLVIFEGQSCLRFGPMPWTVWLDWKYGTLVSKWTFFSLSSFRRRTNHTISISLWRVFWNMILSMAETKRTLIRTTD